MKSNIKTGLIITVSTVVIFLLFLEIALQVIRPYTVEHRMYSYSRNIIQYMFSNFDEELGYVTKPSSEIQFNNTEFSTTVTTNTLGFRDDEFVKEKKEGITRIALLGDSFAFGWGTEKNEIFSEIVEQESGGTIESYNFGVSGYGTLQQLMLFENTVLSYKPDIAVIAFYGNDPGDNFSQDTRPRLKITDEGYVIDKSFVTPKDFEVFMKQDKAYYKTGLMKHLSIAIHTLKKFFRNNSYAYNFISPRLKKVFKKKKGEKGFNHEHWDAEIYLFDKWLTLCKENGIKPVIAIIPEPGELKPSLIESRGGFKFDNVARRSLLDYCKEREISCLDVSDNLSEEEKEAYFYRLDGHMTPFGHRHYAKALQDLLGKNN